MNGGSRKQSGYSSMNIFYLISVITLLFCASSNARQQSGENCGKIVINCDDQTGTIGDEKIEIACGSQTGREKGSKGTKASSSKLGDIVKASGKRAAKNGGKGLKKGTEMLPTSPNNICDNCFFHVGGVTKGATSAGCIHVKQPVFEKLKSCKGSEVAIINNEGKGRKRKRSGGQSIATR